MDEKQQPPTKKYHLEDKSPNKITTRSQDLILKQMTFSGILIYENGNQQ